MQDLTIRIPLRPVAASRPRIPRYGKPYFPKTYKKWRDDADLVVPEFTGTPIEFPVAVTVMFAIPRARTSQLIVPVGDVDNFEKGLYDLLTRKLYLLDDKWITSTECRKRFLPFGEDGYCTVTIKKETEEIDLWLDHNDTHK